MRATKGLSSSCRDVGDGPHSTTNTLQHDGPAVTRVKLGELDMDFHHPSPDTFPNKDSTVPTTNGLVGREPGESRARLHCRFARPLSHFEPVPPTNLAPLFLKRQCDRTLGESHIYVPRDYTVFAQIGVIVEPETGWVTGGTDVVVSMVNCHAWPRAGAPQVPSDAHRSLSVYHSDEVLTGGAPQFECRRAYDTQGTVCDSLYNPPSMVMLHDNIRCLCSEVTARPNPRST